MLFIRNPEKYNGLLQSDHAGLNSFLYDIKMIITLNITLLLYYIYVSLV